MMDNLVILMGFERKQEQTKAMVKEKKRTRPDQK